MVGLFYEVVIFVRFRSQVFGWLEALMQLLEWKTPLDHRQPLLTKQKHLPTEVFFGGDILLTDLRFLLTFPFMLTIRKEALPL